MSAPAATLTFLFTDIVASTTRWDRDPAGMRDALAATDDLARSLVTDVGGSVVKSTGDGIFAVFTDAPSACRAAAALVAEAPLPLRAGLHTGTAEQQHGDLFGADVTRAARVGAAANGGQVLVSNATAGLLDPADVVDLGSHHLRGFERPERLWQVLAEGLSPEAQAPNAEEVRSNLPTELSRWIERPNEEARVRRLLEDHPLVTLTGIGGTGKTRLAIRVASTTASAFRDGVFFVDLASVSDPDHVPRAAAAAVGLQLGGGIGGGGATSMNDVLAGALRHQRCLLIVDNCEHLLDACAELAESIVGAGPEVRILATSREALGVAGEQLHTVPSLSTTETTTDGGVSEAVELFMERATSARSDLELMADDAAVVAEICRRLDGLPLAIELAAARVTHLSVRQIAERLDDRFRLLTGGRRRVARQQTLEAALDWSHELLDDPQRALLRRVAVFAGGFSLAMAEEICSGDGVERTAVLDLLGSLVDKSIVTTETTEGTLRYRLLETVRTYAEGKLQTAGEAARYRSRHRDAYLGWLESTSWEDLYFGIDTLRSLVRELPNLRAALEWSKAQGHRDLTGRMAVRMITLWWTEGHNTEGAQWLDWVLEDPRGLTVPERAAHHTVLASTLRGDVWRAPDLAGNLEKAIELGRDCLGGLLVEALGLRALGAGMRAARTGKPEHERQARALAQELVEFGDGHGSPWSLVARQDHGHTMVAFGEVVEAERSFTAVIEGAGGPASPIQTWVVAQLAICRILLDDPDGAREVTGWAIDSAPPGLRVPAPVYFAASLAGVLLGDRVGAATDFENGLDRTHAGIPLEYNSCLLFAGAIAHELEDPATASRLFATAVQAGAARHQRAEPAPFHSPAVYALYRHYVPRVRRALGPEQAQRLRDEGRSMSLDEAMASAREFVQALQT